MRVTVDVGDTADPDVVVVVAGRWVATAQLDCEDPRVAWVCVSQAAGGAERVARAVLTSTGWRADVARLRVPAAARAAAVRALHRLDKRPGLAVLAAQNDTVATDKME